MTAKEWLQSAPKLDRRIDRKIEQLERLKSLAERVTTTISDMPRGTSPDPHRSENIMLNIVEMEESINADIDQLVDLKRAICREINGLGRQEYQDIIEMRYINGYGWDKIAQEMNYTKRWTLKLHGQALLKIRTPKDT